MSDDSAIKKILTPWSNSLFKSLPEFLKQQLLIEREMAGSIKLSQIETEKLVAYMVEEELKNRKKAGTYSGSFAPVSHFFGYQGRSGHPSHFDCSLASTMGFTAGCLIEAGLTGMAVSVNNVTKPSSDWRVGGVPLLAMLSLYPKQGFNTNELVIRSEDVSLTGSAFQKMKVQSSQWRMKDCYTNPGPIQFYLDDSAENNKISMTINMMYEKGDDLTEEIRGLCHSIQNDCIFTEDQHLLHAALASLLSAKQVINSLSRANQ
jgi:diphosphate--fructose-6-phosphate 1-phosphotransferase